jgi:hypothetical protein
MLHRHSLKRVLGAWVDAVLILMTLGALDQSRIVREQLQYISIHDLRSLLSSASITVFFSSKYIPMLNGLCHTATDQKQLWSNLRQSQLDTSEKWAYFVLDVLPAVPPCSRRTARGLLFFRICYCPNSPIRCWEWHLWTSIFQIFS